MVSSTRWRGENCLGRLSDSSRLLKRAMIWPAWSLVSWCIDRCEELPLRQGDQPTDLTSPASHAHCRAPSDGACGRRSKSGSNADVAVTVGPVGGSCVLAQETSEINPHDHF